MSILDPLGYLTGRADKEIKERVQVAFEEYLFNHDHDMDRIEANNIAEDLVNIIAKGKF